MPKVQGRQENLSLLANHAGLNGFTVRELGAIQKDIKKAASTPCEDKTSEVLAPRTSTRPLALKVEVPGVEPGSGEGINELSTCLA
jgi:hypothetical protein